MYLLLISMPLLGAVLAGFLGRKLGTHGAQIVTCICISTTAVLSAIAFYEVALCNSSVTVQLPSWLDTGLLAVNWSLAFDSLTVSMLLAVTFVSSMVHLYSCSYMGADPHQQRFMSYLSMFTFFMLILIAGNNYMVLFLG